MFELLVVFLLVVAIAYYCMTNLHLWLLGNRIPGPKGYPIIGNALMFWGKPNEILHRICKLQIRTYPRIMRLWLGPMLSVILFDARDIEVLFKNKHSMEKADEYRFLSPWLGDSILLSSGNKFRMHKKLMLPGFHSSILRKCIGVFNHHAMKLVNSLQSYVGKEEFDIHNYLYLTTFSILLETTLGVNHEILGSENIIEYGRAVSQLCKIFHIRCYTLWMRIDWLFQFSKLKKNQDTAINFIHQETEKVITKRKEELSKMKGTNEEYGAGHSRKCALLDLLLQATTMEGKKLTDQEIKDEILTVMLAGQDTTMNTIGFALSLLGLYQDVQDKVNAELVDIFGTSDRTVRYPDLSRMVYLERVILETWRLYPPGAMIARKTTAHIELETCTLPKGCSVAIMLGIMHRDPKMFENPNKFDPDNFLPAKVQSRHPSAYLPFSGGIRKCLGGQYAIFNIKVLLSTLLRHYRIVATTEEKDFKLVAELTLKRKEGFLVGLESRTSKLIKIYNTNETKSYM